MKIKISEQILQLFDDRSAPLGIEQKTVLKNMLGYLIYFVDLPV